MLQLENIFQELFLNPIQQLYKIIAPFLPKIWLAIIIMFIGWVCAYLVRKIVRKLLKGLGLDIVSEKIGLKGFLERGGITRSLSSVIGRVFYWLIIISAVFAVLHTINVKLTPQLLKGVYFYAFKAAFAIFLVFLGIFIAQFAGTFVKTTARMAKLSFYAALEHITRYIIIGIAVIIALEQVGIATTITVQLFFIIFGLLPLAVSIVLAFGGRDTVSGILAGWLLRSIYKQGEKIEFDSVSGNIESINFVTTTLKHENKVIIIPNAELAKRIVKK